MNRSADFILLYNVNTNNTCHVHMIFEILSLGEMVITSSFVRVCFRSNSASTGCASAAGACMLHSVACCLDFPTLSGKVCCGSLLLEHLVLFHLEKRTAKGCIWCSKHEIRMLSIQIWQYHVLTFYSNVIFIF